MKQSTYNPKHSAAQDLSRSRQRFRLQHELPVDVAGGRLTMRACPQVGAVLMPAQLGQWVLAKLASGSSAAPVIAHRGVTYFFLTAGCADTPDLPARLPALLFTERVTILQPGSLITLPVARELVANCCVSGLLSHLENSDPPRRRFSPSWNGLSRTRGRGNPHPHYLIRRRQSRRCE